MQTHLAYKVLILLTNFKFVAIARGLQLGKK
jgi:hypothetical protein